jgi:dTDP-glucose 4,6-dehydratase
MDNLITGDLKNIEHLFKLENFEFYHHDITKFVHVQVNWIISYTLPHRKSYRLFKNSYSNTKVGSLGTHNLLGLAREKARILIASTSEVYGDPLVHPQTEEYYGNVNTTPEGFDELNDFKSYNDGFAFQVRRESYVFLILTVLECDSMMRMNVYQK